MNHCEKSGCLFKVVFRPCLWCVPSLNGDDDKSVWNLRVTKHDVWGVRGVKCHTCQKFQALHPVKMAVNEAEHHLQLLPHWSERRPVIKTPVNLPTQGEHSRLPPDPKSWFTPFGVRPHFLQIIIGIRGFYELWLFFKSILFRSVSTGRISGMCGRNVMQWHETSIRHSRVTGKLACFPSFSSQAKTSLTRVLFFTSSLIFFPFFFSRKLRFLLINICVF